MKFNTNSNVYIITYSVVMVVVVAVLLAVTALSLKERQQSNALAEKQQQIVKALGAEGDFASVIKQAIVLDAKCQPIEGADALEAIKDVKGSFAAGQYPLFVAQDGSVVVPMYGAGLWDDIWGYVALEPDMNTIKGIVFSHKGETPGLGAEIATDKHQAQYVGKTIFEGDELVSVTLVKGGAAAGSAHEVDAITGGTKTSNGVTEMMSKSLGYYKPYFMALRATAAAPVEEAAAEGETNVNTENNEQ